MTYPITNRISNYKLQITNSQPGVTLLLAILLLSTILAISFSLATILLFQVRTSEDFSRTEGALYAADGVAEQSLFTTMRQASSTYVSSFNNNASLVGQPVSSSTTTPIFQDKVLPNTAFLSTQNKYDFCSDVATTSGCGYGKITLTYLSTGNTNPLIVYLCQFNPNTNYGEAPCTSTSTNMFSQYWITNSNLNGGGALPDYPSDPNGVAMLYNGLPLSWNLDSSQQQQLILFNPATNGNPIYVSIETYAADGETPKGIPLSGKTSVSINVSNATTGRKIQVIVPNGGNNASSGSSPNPPQSPWRTLSNNVLSNSGGAFNMGYKFTVNKSGQITQLAIRTADNLNHSVYLYDATNSSILASTNLIGNNANWVVGSITPVSVISGHSYVVSVDLGLSGIWYYENTAAYPQTTGDVTINDTRYGPAGAAMPAIIIGPNMDGQADMTFVPN